MFTTNYAMTTQATMLCNTSHTEQHCKKVVAGVAIKQVVSQCCTPFTTSTTETIKSNLLVYKLQARLTHIYGIASVSSVDKQPATKNTWIELSKAVTQVGTAL